MARTVELERAGLTLSALQWPADSSRPLVVLLHGFPDTPHGWSGVAERLVDAGYRVLAPWLRGYTPGSVQRSAEYTVSAAADDIEAWIDEPAHLVGHDWGAFVATMLANRNPSAWISVSLLAIPPVPEPQATITAAPQLPRQAVLSAYIPVMASPIAARLLGRDDAALVRRIWRHWSPGWDFTEAEFEQVRTVFTDRDLAWAATGYYRSLFTPQRRATRSFYRDACRAPRIPTLALAGVDDGCMHVGIHRALASRVSGVEAVQLPGCGHFLQAECPEPVADHLIRHFRRQACS